MSDDYNDIELDTAEKRAHHNALERKRRDHIKDSFSSLKNSVPSLRGEKVASRAQILKKSTDYIQYMRRKHVCHQQEIDNLKRQNSILESQIKILENVNASGNYAMESSELPLDGSGLNNSDASDEEVQNSKKLKV